MQSMNNKKRRRFGMGDLIVVFLFLSVIAGIVIFSLRNVSTVEELNSWQEFEELLLNGDIKTVEYKGEEGSANSGNKIVYGEYSEAKVKAGKYKGYEIRVNEKQLDLIFDLIEQYDLPAEFKGPIKVSTFDWFGLITIVGGLGLSIFLIIIIFRNSASSNNKAFDFAKSRARLTSKGTTSFKDVAGLDEEKDELIEVVDFLKNPQKYFAMGARIPKGILLVGAPGTGKTLLARAVAGEANVPFYSISGSDFVEMFVGVGASRVRDMFKTAKQNAPCIVFIDEIDAVGRQRGTGLGGGHDEREQTLNQLLVEMDGFAGNSGIIVMAATNRADVLDPALLRPGRFDRQITISNPGVLAREQILKVHARNKKFSPRVNLADVARRTPGFSGADLENLLNEAALLAARENCKEIKIYHVDEAIDRVIMGPAKKSKKYTEREKALVAYHEAGHAVVGIRLKYAQKVQKITIVPRGMAGGYNLMTPEEETFLQTKETLTAEIVSLLAGRIAETLVFNQMSTGAHNDFQKATAIARAMVTEYGMSNLGPIQYERQTGSVFLGRDYMTDKNFSDQVALEIDQEVRRIIDECYKQGEQLLKENRSLLDLLAKHLVEIETLTKEDIEELVNSGKLNWWEKKKAKMAELEEKLSQMETSSEEVVAEEKTEQKEENNETR